MTEWRWPVRRSNAELGTPLELHSTPHTRNTDTLTQPHTPKTLKRLWGSAFFQLTNSQLRFLLKAHRLNAHEATPVASSCEHADVCVRVIRRPGGFRAQQRRRGVSRRARRCSGRIALDAQHSAHWEQTTWP